MFNCCSIDAGRVIQAEKALAELRLESSHRRALLFITGWNRALFGWHFKDLPRPIPAKTEVKIIWRTSLFILDRARIFFNAHEKKYPCGRYDEMRYLLAIMNGLMSLNRNGPVSVLKALNDGCLDENYAVLSFEAGFNIPNEERIVNFLYDIPNYNKIRTVNLDGKMVTSEVITILQGLLVDVLDK